VQAESAWDASATHPVAAGHAAHETHPFTLPAHMYMCRAMSLELRRAPRTSRPRPDTGHVYAGPISDRCVWPPPTDPIPHARSGGSCESTTEHIHTRTESLLPPPRPCPCTNDARPKSYARSHQGATRRSPHARERASRPRSSCRAATLLLGETHSVSVVALRREARACACSWSCSACS